MTLLLAVSGCESDEAAWQRAAEADTIAGYEAFARDHPDSPLVAQAEQQIRALRARDRWRAVTQTDTAEAYRAFLAEFSDADEAVEAQERIDELERQAEWAELRSSTDAAELRGFADRHAGHDVAQQARERAETLDAAAAQEQAAREEEARRAATATHRVQLAAFRSESQARESAQGLEDRLAGVLGESRIEVASSGSWYLLRTQPMSEESARNLCQRLKTDGQDCLVVQR